MIQSVVHFDSAQSISFLITVIILSMHVSENLPLNSAWISPPSVSRSEDSQQDRSLLSLLRQLLSDLHKRSRGHRLGTDGDILILWRQRCVDVSPLSANGRGPAE